MRFLVLLASLFTASAYRVETVSTTCFWIHLCVAQHAKEIETRINRDANYVSHSTLNTKSTIYTFIVFK